MSCALWDLGLPRGISSVPSLCVVCEEAVCVLVSLCLATFNCTVLIQAHLFELPVVRRRGFKVAMHGFDISEHLARRLRQEKNKVFLSLCNNEKQ